MWCQEHSNSHQSDKKFEIAILLKIVQRSYKKSGELQSQHQPPRAYTSLLFTDKRETILQHTLFPQTHLIKILRYILLKIVQTLDNKNFRADKTPLGPGAGFVSYALCIYMVLIEGMLT